jgi:hypothetical protein
MINNRQALAAMAVILLMLSLGCVAPGGKERKDVLTPMGWTSMIGVALLIVIFLVVLAFMISSAIGDDKMKAFAKHEASQLVYSGIIIVVVFAFASSLDSWMQFISLAGSDKWNAYIINGVCCADTGVCAQGYEPSKRACHINIASDYLQILYETGRTNVRSALNHYQTYAFLSKMSITSSMVDPELAQASSKPFAGLSVSADYYYAVIDLTLKSMMIIRTQQIFLDLMYYPLFPVMLAMGLVLRIFYFSRRLGGTLMALALSAYIVLPMFYVLANAILWGFMGEMDWIANVHPNFGNTASNPTIFGDDASNYYSSNYNPNYLIKQNSSVTVGLCSQEDPALTSEWKGALTQFESDYEKIDGTDWLTQAFDAITGTAFTPSGALGKLATLLVFSTVVPFLGLMTMLSTYKVISPMLGGDVEIALLSRLI